MQHKDAVDALFGDYVFNFDADDRLINRSINATAATFTYDNTDQLTGATGPSTETYTYDLNGNRTMTGYTTGTDNRLTNDGVWTYTYDAEGNLTKKSKGALAETWTYSYDNWNRLISAKQRSTDGGTLLKQSEYIYDVLGNRIQRRIDQDGNGTWETYTRHVYVDQMTWADLDRDSALTIRYMFGDKIDEMFSRIVVNDINWISAWYFTDQLGSVRHLTSSAGTVIASLDYDSFGKLVGLLDPDIDRFRFTGREWDGETQLQYSRARHYDPIVGRFTTQDPLQCVAGDLNYYRYVRNTPTNATDPTGLWINIAYYGAILAYKGLHYGNYCGPSWPWSEDASDPNSPPGINDLDDACKEHDKCYGKNGSSWYAALPGLGDDKSADCDKKLCQDAKKVDCDRDRRNDTALKRMDCKRMKAEVEFWFCTVKG